MYRCPKLVDVPVVLELPTGMYKTPMFNVITDFTDTSPSLCKSSPQTSVLEARQEAVLDRLRTLKEQLDRLQSTRVTAAAAATSASVAPTLGAAAHSSPAKTSGKHIQDLVISASPSTPPLSLLLLRRLLAQAGCPVYMASRLHSSVARVNPELQEAFSDSPLGDRTRHSLAFSLQWVDMSTPSLMVSPLRQTKIAGEVNIVRYVSRLFPAASPFNYEATGTYAAIADVDQLLDTLERQLVWGGGKERQAALRSVAVRLARSPFLCGDLCGVADVVAWSLVRQKGVVASGHKEVVSWLAKMDAMAGIDIDNILQQQKQNKTQQTKANASKNSTTGGGGGGVSVSAKVEEKRNLAPKGGKHLGRKELQTYLEELGISYQVREHKEVFTVEELMEQVRGIPGVVTKNLFLRDKKKKLYLLSTRHDTEVDLKTVASQVGTKDLRFADETILLDTLGVRQGCVSALALANDASSRLVQFLVERSALDPSVPFVNFHPMSNAATLGLTPADLEKFLVATGHPPTFVTFQ